MEQVNRLICDQDKTLDIDGDGQAAEDGGNSTSSKRLSSMKQTNESGHDQDKASDGDYQTKLLANGNCTVNKQLASIKQANKSGQDQDKAMEVDEDEEKELEEGGNWMDDVYIPPPPPPPSFCGDETGVQLVIQKIEILPFNSRQSLSRFYKSFQLLVGSNGLGTSVLYLFGYRAQKRRQQSIKLAILIHKTETQSGLDFCRVDVHLALVNYQHGQDVSVNKYIKKSIPMANKDNSAYYLINDRRVDFKEVSSLLQHHGIDLRYNRFQILQDEVEQIALMKPKADNEHESGMLEFLEDIIGSARLKELIAIFALEVNNVSAAKMNRVRVVEKELKSLKKAKNEAIKFLEKQNEEALLKSKLFRSQMSDAREGDFNEAVADQAINIPVVGFFNQVASYLAHPIHPILRLRGPPTGNTPFFADPAALGINVVQPSGPHCPCDLNPIYREIRNLKIIVFGGFSITFIGFVLVFIGFPNFRK